MLPNFSDGQYLRHLPQLQKAALSHLNLSDCQRSTVDYYYQLSTLSDISVEEAYKLSEIWQQAEDDEKLTQALVLIDGIQSNCLQGERLLSEDKDLRAYLSEHIPVLAEAKLRGFQGNRFGLDPQRPHMTMLCPDGSGFVQRAIPEGGIFNLDEMKQQICEKCNAKLSEHENLIFVAGGSIPSSTS